MKEENCIEVKHVSRLSVAYLTRFFGSVGGVLKVQKDEISKYVTIEYIHHSSVEKAFRFSGRVLDSRPIKIKKNQQIGQLFKFNRKESLSLNRSPEPSPIYNISDSTYSSLNSAENLWHLVEQEIKPHNFEKSEGLLVAMFVWSLIDLLLASAKHILKYKVNMRVNYMLQEVEKYLIDKMTRSSSSGSGAIVLAEGLRTNVEWKGDLEALVWFTVPFPNVQEEQSKIESTSSMTKCIHIIKGSLSLRLAEIVYLLNSASLCHNLEETCSKELITLNQQVTTSQDDNFTGLIDNLGAKNIFYQFLRHEQPNTCIYRNESQTVKRFQCTLRLQGCQQDVFEDSSWCNMYDGNLARRKLDNQEGQVQFKMQRLDKIEKIDLKENVLVFESGNFSLKTVEQQVNIFRELCPGKEVMVFYLTKQACAEKTHQFKKVYEDNVMNIEEEVLQQKEDKSPSKGEEAPQVGEGLNKVIEIELKAENGWLFNHVKLAHYLEAYIAESIEAKKLIIASKEVAIKLAGNIVEREKDNRLFQYGDRKFEQLVGEQLWRVYNRQGERKIKNILSHFSRGKR